MEDIVYPTHRPGQQFPVLDGTFEIFVRQTVEVLAESGTQIVHHPDLRASLEALHHMTSNKSGSSGDDNSHEVRLRGMTG